MKVKVPETGGVCKSLQGRDKGCLYVIVNVEPGYVYVADGKAKTVESPKKKNLKHVYLMPRKVDFPKKGACDGEIHRALKAIEAENKTEDGECQKVT